MALTADQIASKYPLPTYRFVVTVGNETMPFSNVSGLQIQHETLEYKDGTGGHFRMPGQKQPVNLTLRRGVIKGQSQLYDWINSIHFNTVEKKDISISLTNETGSKLFITWNVANAFPTSLSAPSLDATSNEVAVEELSLAADGVSVRFH